VEPVVQNHSSEIVVYSQGALLRKIESVDPGGRVAKIKGPTSEFVVVSTGTMTPIPSIGYQFSLDPEAAFFVTLHPTPDTQKNSSDTVDEVVLRRVGDPNDVIHTVKRAIPAYGESSLAVQQSRQYLCVSSYLKENSMDPPFRSRYEHETIIFGTRTGTEIATVPFVVDTHWCSQGPGETLTVLRGSTEDRNDYHAILDNERRVVIWHSRWDDARIENLYTSESRQPRAFVIGYAARPGAIHRVTDGGRLATLTGVVTRVLFAPNCADYLVVWYRSGHCELWWIESAQATRVAELGLIVSDVQFIPGGRMIVRHADGRTYVTDMAWLLRIQEQGLSTAQAVQALRHEQIGPLGTPWWQVGHPNHHPWRAANSTRRRKRNHDSNTA
jgi:hypothetical protein